MHVFYLQIREHRRAIFDSGNGQSTAACPLGIHQIGRCTCDSFLVAEESSARASVSRIVMLTEALFEVCSFPWSFKMELLLIIGIWEPFSINVLNLFLSCLIHWIVISILVVFVEELSNVPDFDKEIL